MATRVDLNNANIGAILKGTVGRVRPDLVARGRRVAAAAGSGHMVEERVGRTRLRVTVRTVRPVPARRREVLRRAFGAAR